MVVICEFYRQFGCLLAPVSKRLLIRRCTVHPALCVAFMAPEVITDSENAGRAADIWSLGCVLIEMATGKVTVATRWKVLLESTTPRESEIWGF